MEIMVREADSGDTAIVVELINEMAAPGNQQSPITEEYVNRYLASPASKVLLAEKHGQVLGLLSYSMRPDLYHAANSCLIEELMVQEGSRGQGVGGTLLAELFSRLEASRCAEVSLAVMPDNVKAIRFYRRHGLTEEALFLEKHF
jgi:ribosomal protein S18 acetylase RimI-like enzyme